MLLSVFKGTVDEPPSCMNNVTEVIEGREVSNGEKLRISFPRISRKEFPTVGEFRHVHDSSASPPPPEGAQRAKRFGPY